MMTGDELLLMVALPPTLSPVRSSALRLFSVRSPAAVVPLKEAIAFGPPSVVLPTEVVVSAVAEIWLKGSCVIVVALTRALPATLSPARARSPLLLNARSPPLVPLNDEAWLAPSSVVLPEEVVPRPLATIRPLGPALIVVPLRPRLGTLTVPLTLMSPAFRMVAKPLTLSPVRSRPPVLRSDRLPAVTVPLNEDTWLSPSRLASSIELIVRPFAMIWPVAPSSIVAAL